MPKDNNNNNTNNNNTSPLYIMTKAQSSQIIAQKMRQEIDKKYPYKTEEEKKVLLANQLVKIKSIR